MASQGASAQYILGMVAGVFGFAAFFYVTSFAQGNLPILASYLSAITSALIMQVMALKQLRHRERNWRRCP